MSLQDTLMGKTKIESFKDFENMMSKRVERYKEEKNLKKKEKVKFKLKRKLVKFFKGLKKLGIEVHLEGKDGKGIIREWDIMKNLDLERVFKVYVIKTIKKIDEEIERRSKNE